MSGEPPATKTPSGGRRRSAARLAAVQALYQIDLSAAAPEPVIAEFLQHRLGRDQDGDNYGQADAALFGDIVRGAVDHRDAIDAAIAGALTPDWPLDRLEITLRAILRAGAYELSLRRDVPGRVIINEYIDIAHAFFAGKEPGFVNGVLDRMAQSSRPEEVSRDGGAASR
jgi:N utilization substance protein B